MYMYTYVCVCIKPTHIYNIIIYNYNIYHIYVVYVWEGKCGGRNVELADSINTRARGD